MVITIERQCCILYGVVGTVSDAFTGSDTLGRHRRRAISCFPVASLNSS